MGNRSLWEKEAAVHLVSCKLFRTKRELAMRQEAAEVGPGCPDSEPLGQGGRQKCYILI